MLWTITELSLNLLIKTIVATNFKPGQCIAYYNRGYDLGPIAISPYFEFAPVIINDYTCSHGCHQFIMEDPHTDRCLSNNPNCLNVTHNCMIKNQNTDIKLIVYLQYVKTEEYIIESVGLYEIVIFKRAEYFYIGGYSDLHKKSPVLLNAWDYQTKHDFVLDQINVNHFFDDRWSKDQTCRLIIQTMDMNDETYKFSTIILSFFAEFLKINKEVYLIPIVLEKFDSFPDSFILFRILPNQQVFSQSYPTKETSYYYMIPEHNEYNHWLKILQVFEIPFWLMIIISAFMFAGYFWLEQVGTQPFWSIMGLFLLQSMNVVPQGLRPRIILFLALILIVIYSSLFASCVVTQMISPWREPGIETEDDINKFGYAKLNVKDFLQNISLHNPNSWEKNNNLTVERYISEYRKNKWKGFVIQYEFTETGLSQYNFNPGYKKLQDGMDRNYQYIYAHGSIYGSLLPKLNNFILRCRETGLLTQWEWMYYFKARSIFNNLQLLDNSIPLKGPVELKLDHVAGPFWFLSLGLTLASCVFGCEILYNNIIRAITISF